MACRSEARRARPLIRPGLRETEGELRRGRVVDGLPDGQAPRLCVEPKLDGAGVEVVYDEGRLVQASTRGDGETGEEITANIRTIRSVPLRIAHLGKLTLRGEILIYRRDHDALNAECFVRGCRRWNVPPA